MIRGRRAAGRTELSVHRAPVEDDRGTRELLRRWAFLLDNAFGIPGTRLRVGLDPILGLLPGVGDLATPIFSVLLFVHAARVGVPRIVLARMVLNAAIDGVVGAVPVLGDLFDAGWKANARNLALLERHATPGARRSTAGDWLVVGGGVAVVAALVFFGFYLLYRFLRALGL